MVIEAHGPTWGLGCGRERVRDENWLDRWTSACWSGRMPRQVSSEPPDSYGEVWANVYDEEHSFLVPAEEQLDLLEHLADDRPVLELGIGTGRVALPLAARGIDVSGIDASRSMVDRMRSKPGGADITVTIGDMADLPVVGTFGLVYVVFNTLFGLGSQGAQAACFKSVARVLQPGGYFCMECFVPDLARFHNGQSLRTVRLGMDDVRIDASLHDPVHQRIDTNIVRLASAGISVLPVHLRYAWPAELDLMGDLAGLRQHRRWADWNQHPFTAASTSHITVYRKAA